MTDTTDRQRVSTQHAPTPRRVRAFSLIELVIVVVVIGILAAIAVPRMSNASDDALRRQVVANAQLIQMAFDLFMDQHPAYDPDGETDRGKSASLAGDLNPPNNILLNLTDEGGGFSPPTPYGPYLREMPKNLLVHQHFAYQFLAEEGSVESPADPPDVLWAGWSVAWNGGDPRIGYRPGRGTDPPVYDY